MKSKPRILNGPESASRGGDKHPAQLHLLVVVVHAMLRRFAADPTGWMHAQNAFAGTISTWRRPASACSPILNKQ